MSFTGVNTLHLRQFPDGTVSLSVQARETATWTEDGVTHTVPFQNSFVFNRMDPLTAEAAIFTVSLHGVGSASDGSTTTVKLIGHAVLATDGSLRVEFTRGTTDCGR